ncbi:hypothetical protein DPMN_144771 [Dreissena polymorpha]|uniref:Uncharacterized protein n=1 Tax=Dreissena polymorpha TaxID=45954 RepID=A0A9D4F3S3_DREPO|nr:hypothetical protein DPMN_144771 [Dreissena polymorpha]
MSAAIPPPLNCRRWNHRLLQRHLFTIDSVVKKDDHANARGDTTQRDFIPSVAERYLGIAGIRDIAALGPLVPLAVSLLFLDGISGLAATCVGTLSVLITCFRQVYSHWAFVDEH